MRISDRERVVLIKNMCERLGKWAITGDYNSFSDSTMKSIHEDAERLVELLDARELSLYRRRGAPPREFSEEG